MVTACSAAGSAARSHNDLTPDERAGAPAASEVTRRPRWRIERATPKEKVSISDFELYLGTMSHATSGFRTAAEVALELLEDRSTYGAV